MRARYYVNGKELVFKVPRKHYTAVLNSLKPAWEKDGPNKCVVKGDIELKHGSDNRLSILFLERDYTEGVYEIHTSEKRYYFHGGRVSEIDDAIYAAYKDSLKEVETAREKKRRSRD